MRLMTIATVAAVMLTSSAWAESCMNKVDKELAQMDAPVVNGIPGSGGGTVLGRLGNCVKNQAQINADTNPTNAQICRGLREIRKKKLAECRDAKN